MSVYLALALVALVQVGVAFACHGALAGRVASGGLSYGRASAIVLVVLLVAPALAAVLVPPLVSALFPGGSPAAGLGLYAYVGYAVGLACFIVLNRRFRDIR